MSPPDRISRNALLIFLPLITVEMRSQHGQAMGIAMYHGAVDLHIFYISIETKCSNCTKRYSMRVRREVMTIYRYQIETIRNKHLDCKSSTSTEQEWYG